MSVFTDKFRELGCNEEWVVERDLANERIERARTIAISRPRVVKALGESSDPKALYVAAMLHKKGFVDPSFQLDSKGIERLLGRAADGGNAHAIYEQAKALMEDFPYYSNAPGDPKMFVKINGLLQTAALAGSGRAARELSRRIGGDYVQKKFPGEVIPGNDKPWGAWAEIAADLGDDEAQQSLSYGRRDIGLDPAQANRWLEASARSGNDHANYYLGGNYENGTDGYPMDLDKAIYFHCRSIYFGGQWSGGAIEQILAFKAQQQAPKAPSVRPTQIVFGTGSGTGKYDRMTYDVYASTMEFIPVRDMTATALKPHLWYCNGLCFFNATIQNARGEILASMRWQGTNVASPFLVFDAPIRFSAGQAYTFSLQGSTSKSIGVVTIGQDKSDPATAKIRTIASRIPERGSLAFELWK